MRIRPLQHALNFGKSNHFLFYAQSVPPVLLYYFEPVQSVLQLPANTAIASVFVTVREPG
jgi:hypothetical protein